MIFKQKFKQAISSYSFWTTLAGALALIGSAIGKAFSLKIEEQIISDIVMAIAGVLVAVGIVTMPSKKSEKEIAESDDETSPEDQDKTEKED